MSLLDLCRKRWSVRNFTGDPVSAVDMEYLKEVGRWAATSRNRQARRFVVVRDPENIRELVRAANMQEFVARAGTLIFGIAEDAGGAPVGTYYIGRNQGGGGAHVCNCGFATATEARGRGVARDMLRHALATARKAGYRAMQFNFVVTTNSRAITIWRDHGFEVVGRLPGAFDHPRAGYVDALVMYKQL